MVGLVVAVGVTALVGLVTAAPAWAHSRLQRTNPADAATVTAPINEVVLTFNERVHGDFTTVVVTRVSRFWRWVGGGCDTRVGLGVRDRGVR